MITSALEQPGQLARSRAVRHHGKNSPPSPLSSQVEDPALRLALLESERPSFDTESSFDPEVSGPKGRTKCGVEDRVVSEVEPPKAGRGGTQGGEFTEFAGFLLDIRTTAQGWCSSPVVSLSWAKPASHGTPTDSEDVRFTPSDSHPTTGITRPEQREYDSVKSMPAIRHQVDAIVIWNCRRVAVNYAYISICQKV